jgi:hypothetical protein
MEGGGMDKRFSEMGWSCFEKASPASVNVMGLGHAATLIKAFQKLVRQPTTAKFNCLEITEAVHKEYLSPQWACQEYQAAAVVIGNFLKSVRGFSDREIAARWRFYFKNRHNSKRTLTRRWCSTVKPTICPAHTLCRA